jgi:sec-independent protein translocase protein TatA
MIGSGEFGVIALLALLFFGPEKLPDLARSLGRAVAEYRRAAEELDKDLAGELSLYKKEFTEIAENLGISTENKSIAQILDEIKEKTERGK